MIHRQLAASEAAVLVVPNCILGLEDVPTNQLERISMQSEFRYPGERKYVLHQMCHVNEDEELYFPNGREAAFHRSAERNQMPSVVLLAYAYGAAVIRNFGQNWGSAAKEFNQGERRPEPRKEPETRSPKRTPNRKSTLRKLQVARGKVPGQGEVDGQVVEDAEDLEMEEMEEYDPMDYLLCFSGRSDAVQERREHDRKEFDDKIKIWASRVAQ